MAKHAMVPTGEYLVPLIGVPMRHVLEICDACGKDWPMREIELRGYWFLCPVCAWKMKHGK